MEIQELLMAYIWRGRRASQRRALESYSHKIPQLKYLLYLVDVSRDRAKPSRKMPIDFQPLSYDATLLLLQHIFADDFSKQEARTLLDQLSYNPEFLSQLVPMLPEEPVSPELTAEERAQCRYLSVHEIYRNVVEALNRVQSRPNTQTFPLERAREWLAQLGSFGHSAPAHFAFVAAVVVLVGSAILFWPHNESVQMYKFYFESEPYAGNVINTLRSGSSQSVAPLFNMLRVAQSNYLSGNYNQAIRVLNTLERNIATREDPEQVTSHLQRDIYYYLGMSYLGRSNGKKEQDLIQATRHLQQALQLTERYQLASKDDMLFFLGLAFTLQNQHRPAQTYFKAISPSSPFYEKGSTLME